MKLVHWPLMGELLHLVQRGVTAVIVVKLSGHAANLSRGDPAITRFLNPGSRN